MCIRDRNSSDNFNMKPRKKRDVLYPPNVQYFKPQGIPMNNLDTVWVTVDEYEAIRCV